MSWLSSIAVGLLTAAAGCIASGFVASLAVRWYRISSFEGGSGYYVVFIALGGLIGGLLVGLIASRIVAAGANPGFLKGLGVSLGVTFAITLMVAVPARLLADVPPTVDGEELMLMVEARWPATHSESPATAPGISYLELGSLTGSRVQRISKRGALWKEDARLVDGQWTVTGAVPVFTERGQRVLDIALNDTTHAAFVAALPARPTTKQFEWSEWYPKNGKAGAARSDIINFRFRVQKVSQPVRTEHFGNFEVSMVPQYFQTTSAPGTTTLEAWASNFEIVYKGKPGTLANGAPSPLKFNSGMVALLPNASTTLLASLAMQDANYGCSLLSDDHGTLRIVPVAQCSNGIEADDVTSDTARYREIKKAKLARGHVDQGTYANARDLLFSEAMLNIATLEVRKFSASIDPTRLSTNPGVPPLGISPDHRSFVRYAVTNGSVNHPVLVVTDVMANTVTEIPVEEARMRFGNTDDLTVAWVNHHFTWERGADGVDKLVERQAFAPLPYHGNTTVEGEQQEYYKIERGGQVVRMALIEMLQKDFGAVRDTIKDNSYSYIVVVKGIRVSVATNGEPSDYVMMSLDYGQPASQFVGELGKAFDSVLATGKYDAALAPRTGK